MQSEKKHLYETAQQLFLDKKKLRKGVQKVFHKESIIMKEKSKTPRDNKKIS